MPSNPFADLTPNSVAHAELDKLTLDDLRTFKPIDLIRIGVEAGMKAEKEKNEDGG